MASESAKRTNRRSVYEALRRKVLTLEVQPGAPLSENELAAALGVSRTPIRESLILLSEEGLVHIFPQIGSFASRVDPARVADAQFLREAVELASLDDLSSELDPELVDEIRHNLDEQQKPGVSLDDFFELDEAFHAMLMRLSGHEGVWHTVASAKGHLDRVRRLGLYDTAASPSFAAQHVGIFQSVLDGDLQRAREAMRSHLRAVFDDVERIRAHSPELFATDPDSVPVRRNIVVWE